MLMDPMVEVESFSYTAKNFLQVAPPLERTLLEAPEKTPTNSYMEETPLPVFLSEALSTLIEPRGDVLVSHFLQGPQGKESYLVVCPPFNTITGWMISCCGMMIDAKSVAQSCPDL